MPNQKHNLMTVVGDLSAKLATRSRHVCLLIGAGASVSAGLPDIAGLTTMVRDAISHNYRKQLESLLNSRNIEQALSRIRRTAALLDGKETFYDLTKESAAELDLEICKHIIEAIRSPKSREAFNDLGAWANRADYHCRHRPPRGPLSPESPVPRGPPDLRCGAEKSRRRRRRCRPERRMKRRRAQVGAWTLMYSWRMDRQYMGTVKEPEAAVQFSSLRAGWMSSWSSSCAASSA